MTETITTNVTNIWLYIAITEFVVIIVLFILLLMEKFKHSKEAKVKQKLKDGDIDIGGTFRIISKLDDAAKLHDKLKKKCHPDKFVGDKDKAEIANKLSQAINENKNNYYKLVELQQQAIKELNISIN